MLLTVNKQKDYHKSLFIHALYLCQHFCRSLVAVSSWSTPACCCSLCCSLWGWMESSSGATGRCSHRYGCGSCWSSSGRLWALECGRTTPSTGRLSRTWRLIQPSEWDKCELWNLIVGIIFVAYPQQGRRGDVCGVQSHADRSGPPRAVADVRGAGVWPRGERKLLLAARLHASLLCIARLCSSLRLGVQTRPLPWGEESDVCEETLRPE